MPASSKWSDTGNVKILKYVAVHDIGQPIQAAAEGRSKAPPP